MYIQAPYAAGAAAYQRELFVHAFRQSALAFQLLTAGGMTFRAWLVAAAIILSCLIGLTTFSTTVLAQSTAYPVKLGSSGRHLVDQIDRPFFINGESAWSLISNIPREDVNLFLDNRQQKGYNVFLAMLINHLFSAQAPRNFYGDAPFTTPGNFNTPNEAYFAHADWVINAAASRGQVIMLAPIYLGWQCGDQGWCNEIRNSSDATMTQWGRYVGTRYRNFPNIIWLIGGDADAVAHGVGAKVQAFVNGLLETDPNHLVTVHNARHQSGASVWPAATWLTLNSVYTDNITYNQSATEYNRIPVKPAFLIEAHYEREWNSTPQSLRAQAYWTVLAGSLAGHVFGHCPVTTFSNGLGACGDPNWKSYLDASGATTVGRVGALFNSRAFHTLVPDLSHTVMTAGYQSGTTYANAARTSDGSSVIAYIPTQRAITLDMTKIAGTSARTWWFNPQTGAATLIGDFPTTGTRNLTPPDGNDWVLVADNAALNLPAPGTTTAPPPPAAPSNLRILSP
jgi:hypothetical protein